MIGFGDRAYLLHDRPNIGAMLAALVPGPGALLVTALRGMPETAFPSNDIVALKIPARGYARLNDFVSRSFTYDTAGALRPLADGPYPGSRFYASIVTYSGWYTCNSWTADALRIAGLPVRSDRVLFARDIMDQARQIAAASH